MLTYLSSLLDRWLLDLLLWLMRSYEFTYSFKLTLELSAWLISESIKNCFSVNPDNFCIFYRLLSIVLTLIFCYILFRSFVKLELSYLSMLDFYWSIPDSTKNSLFSDYWNEFFIMFYLVYRSVIGASYLWLDTALES